ncbi:hypothetical protein KJK00_28690, partial [Klebsiella quasipneumoniae]|uniref:hypothetical protein n=1 Tax=Klebsiella quasipneumoniae TaxID=1463165 RepID=UPI001BDA2647
IQLLGFIMIMSIYAYLSVQFGPSQMGLEQIEISAWYDVRCHVMVLRDLNFFFVSLYLSTNGRISFSNIYMFFTLF